MADIYIMLILALVGFVGTLLIIPMFKKMLIEGEIVRPNYKQDMIPVSMGIVFVPMLVISSMVLAYIDRDQEHMKYLFMFLFAALSMSFAGIMDDIIGNRNVSGLKGHFKSLFKGTLTTGGFKALYGGFVGLLISVVLTRSIPEIVLNTLIIALSTNLRT